MAPAPPPSLSPSLLLLLLLLPPSGGRAGGQSQRPPFSPSSAGPPRLWGRRSPLGAGTAGLTPPDRTGAGGRRPAVLAAPPGGIGRPRRERACPGDVSGPAAASLRPGSRPGPARLPPATRSGSATRWRLLIPQLKKKSFFSSLFHRQRGGAGRARSPHCARRVPPASAAAAAGKARAHPKLRRTLGPQSAAHRGGRSCRERARRFYLWGSRPRVASSHPVSCHGFRWPVLPLGSRKEARISPAPHGSPVGQQLTRPLS
ncbi:uncharacterized protein M6D78_015143 [Vipera latastei]